MGVTAEIRGRNKQFLGVVDQSKRKLRKLKGVASEGFSLGGSLGFSAVFIALKKVADEFDRLEKLSRRLGSSIEETQQLDFIGSQNGANIENLSRALLQMERRLGDGCSTAAAGFADLGINVDKFLKLGATERLIRLAEALEGASDHAATISNLFAIAGRNGEGLIQIVSIGSDALLDLASAAGFLQTVGDGFGSAAGAGLNFADRFSEVGPVKAFVDSVRIADEALSNLEESRAGDSLVNAPLARAVAELLGEINKLEAARRIAKLNASERVEENKGELESLKQLIETNTAHADSIRAAGGAIADSRSAGKAALEGKAEYLELLTKQEKLRNTPVDTP